MSYLIKIVVFAISLWLMGSAYANTVEPIVVNAIITSTEIQFSPDTIPENKPFIIHVINKTNIPVELENTDTSVEIYSNMDKTFRVGLTAGSYVFFNDFNTRIKPATLFVKNETDVATSPVKELIVNDTAPMSTQDYSEILFIIWRESVEGLLVVGVVYSWLKQLKNGRKSGMLFLWLGVLAGLICAFVLSFLLITVKNELSPNSANIFQASVTFVAALMIVYMVKWMRTNSRTLKSGMHSALEKNASNKWRNISIFTVVTVALAREASEASIFIYALGFGSHGESSIKILSTLSLGVVLAVATIYVLQLGNKLFSWRFFFKITEILLLLLGGSLLLNCIDLLIASGYLPALSTRIWDTSFLLKDGGMITPLISSFTGYRATPSLMDVIMYSVYWIFILLLLNAKKRPVTCKIE